MKSGMLRQSFAVSPGVGVEGTRASRKGAREDFILLGGWLGVHQENEGGQRFLAERKKSMNSEM
jgi:hypothetical protein